MRHRTSIDEHIGVVPPSTVDVERIICRERRGRLLRRVGGGGAALTATVLAIGVGVALAGGAQAPYRPGGDGTAALPQALPSPSALPSGFHLETGDAVATKRTLGQLQEALEQALADVAPDARWIYMPDVPGETPLPDGHPAMHNEPGERPGFAARSGLSRKGAKAGFYLRLRPDGCSPRNGGPSVCSQVFSCENSSAPAGCASSTTPGGLSVVEWTETAPADGGKRYLFHNVQIGLRNGHHLTLLAVNYFGGDGSAVSVDEPLLTKVELKAMALAVAGRILG